ncbi:MAG: prolyl-tRNA synthetase [Thermoanaerobaculia bacterium]|nr:prolyl-tRNA synthetase [Thermoanaerobaculia bacterium]
MYPTVTKTANQTAIQPTRADDYAEWYQQVIRAADLAENSPVRGCMVIKPWGYALWENIQRELDAMFKETGHRNAYFPLLIPVSFLEKEAAHVEGFAKECAVVTHHRLVNGPNGTLIPDPKAVLEEPLVVRPTSETIIGAMYAKWVQSYRDLPLLINQWCNVMRWEMRTRLFLRTTEFLWQEGHTAHETEAEAREETTRMLDVYARFAQDYLAIPVIRGRKTDSERFPGAVDTFAIEAMMGDRKALQAGTSHFLGQNFAKASGINFLGRQGAQEFAWTTSWGVSTRLIGGLIMAHSDDNGLVLPPRIAPAHVVILPVFRADDTRQSVLDYVEDVAAGLRKLDYERRPVVVEVDLRDVRGGQRQWEWVKKGVPVRLEIGPRDVENGVVTMTRRDRNVSEKETVSRADLPAKILAALNEIQDGCYQRALEFRQQNTRAIGTKEEFVAFFTPENREQPEIHGGFAVSPWCGNAACEEWVKDALKVTIRCLPLDPVDSGNFTKCVVCGQESITSAIFAKSY